MSINEYIPCDYCKKTNRCVKIDLTDFYLCESCVDKLKNQFGSNEPIIKPKPYESPAKRKARAMYREQGEEIPGDSKYLEDETWTLKDGYLNQNET